MRILWMAGLGAVLVTGAASAQTMGQGQQNYGSQRGPVPEAARSSPNDRSPDNILQRQDPRLEQSRIQGNRGSMPEAGQTSPNDRSPGNTLQRQDPRLEQSRIQGNRGPMPEAGRNSPNDRSPDNTLQRQDPRLDQSRVGEGRTMQRDERMGRQGGTSARQGGPRDDASRAYMGGGLILENGRPVPLPGDAPGAASDFRGENVEQSTARGARQDTGRSGGVMGERGMDPAGSTGRTRSGEPQTN